MQTARSQTRPAPPSAAPPAPSAAAHRAGAKIRAWRRARKLSLEEFAERLGMTFGAVYGWETQGKVARPGAQRRLIDMGVCEAADWLAPASQEGEAAGGAGQSGVGGDGSEADAKGQ